MSLDYDKGRRDIVDKLRLLIDQWEEEAQYRSDIASEDFVSNILYECVDELNEIIESITKGSD